MPKVKDEQFLKRLEEDIQQLDINDEDETNNEDGENEGTSGPAEECVRLKDGIDMSDLTVNNNDCDERRRTTKGFSFEVMGEGMSDARMPSEKNYFDAGDTMAMNEQDPDKIQDLCKSHWNPELNEDDAEFFYQEEAFKKKALTMEDITEEKDGGVMKKVLQQGQGQVVPKNALVRIHYNAFHEHSKTTFDSSRLRGQEQRFQLGNGDVVAGMDLAVSTMRKGELSSYIVQPAYAYGEMGCAPRIPGNMPIMYEIELMNYFESEGSERFFAMNRKERTEVTFKEMCKYVRGDKDAAKEFFNRRSYRDAIGRYLRCIKVLEEWSLSDEEEESEQQNLLRIMYLNTAQCFLHLCRPGRTVVYAKKALYLNQEDVKAMFKVGKAFRLLGEYDKARKYLMDAKKIKPMNAEIGQELEELENSKKHYNALEREQCRKMFSGKDGLLGAVPKATNTSAANGEENKENGGAEGGAATPSDDFKNSVNRRLDDFLKDSDLVEILAGNGNRMFDFELGYICERAQKLGLFYRTHGLDIYLTKKEGPK